MAETIVVNQGEVQVGEEDKVVADLLTQSQRAAVDSGRVLLRSRHDGRVLSTDTPLKSLLGGGTVEVTMERIRLPVHWAGQQMFMGIRDWLFLIVPPMHPSPGLHTGLADALCQGGYRALGLRDVEHLVSSLERLRSPVRQAAWGGLLIICDSVVEEQKIQGVLRECRAAPSPRTLALDLLEGGDAAVVARETRRVDDAYRRVLPAVANAGLYYQPSLDQLCLDVLTSFATDAGSDEMFPERPEASSQKPESETQETRPGSQQVEGLVECAFSVAARALGLHGGAWRGLYDTFNALLREWLRAVPGGLSRLDLDEMYASARSLGLFEYLGGLDSNLRRAVGTNPLSVKKGLELAQLRQASGV